jgi:hypothetical protein
MLVIIRRTRLIESSRVLGHDERGTIVNLAFRHRDYLM